MPDGHLPYVSQLRRIEHAGKSDFLEETAHLKSLRVMDWIHSDLAQACATATTSSLPPSQTAQPCLPSCLEKAPVPLAEHW